VTFPRWLSVCGDGEASIWSFTTPLLFCVGFIAVCGDGEASIWSFSAGIRAAGLEPIGRGRNSAAKA
jgi:hypothetical protein